ncbi:MAG: hypothetical protein IPK68_10060 [Bdellovibrionales bacterium]|nr:hypothetical protein [Bdellovibrionales bacterium]
MIDKGAHFYRCDFQVHTPRDPNWSGPEAKTDEERVAFANSLIRECRKKGLQAIAISDHHDVVMFPFIRQAAKDELDDEGQPFSELNQIVVFPAIELTLGLPCQALLIFDANLPTEFISSIPVALGITPTASTESKIQSPIKKVDHFKDLASVYETLNKNDHLRGKFILLPNVTDNGHGTLLRKGFDSHYREMPCVGAYLDGSASKLGAGNLQILSGKNRDYGFKAVGVIQTSDSRSSDFKSLGEHSTWIKWATPTAEALRQACLAKESRIHQTEPALPTVRITSLRVSNSKFMGPIDLFFSSQYSAFIGGRGTGKSTLLEYLRWGLCDQPPEAGSDESEIPDYHRRRMTLIEKTLAGFGATVDVEFCLNDVNHVVRRSTKGDIQLKVGEKPLRPSSEEEVRSLFPIHAYSQKQLSNVGVRIEELGRFIKQPVLRELEDIDSELSRIGVAIKRTYDAKVASEQSTQERFFYETEVSSITEQMKNIRDSLKGLSEDDQKVVERQVRFEQENAIVEVWKGEVESFKAQFNTFFEDISGMPTATGDGSSQFLSDTYQSLKTTFEAATSKAKIAQVEFEKLVSTQVETKLNAWENEKKQHDLQYKEVQGRSKDNESKISQVTILEGRLKQLQTAIAERTSHIKKYETELKQFDEAVDGYFELLKKRNAVLRRQCELLSELSKGFIRAELREGGSSGGAQAILKEMARGTKIRTEKLDSIFDRIAKSQEPMDLWREVLFDIEKLARLSIKESEKPKLPQTATLDGYDFTDTEKEKLAVKLSATNWIELFLSPLESIPIFRYRSREQEYIDFADASAGQQATALMHVLLNQAGPPLIIDQPEDDLDSNIIEHICMEIWSAKSRRQLIFTSHNANLVVNGDAELVVSCDYRIAGDQSGGKISKEGAIDIDDVRKEITKVMEGGEKAFALRRQKYGF